MLNLIGNQKLQIETTTGFVFYLLDWQNLEVWQYTVLLRMWFYKNSHTLLLTYKLKESLWNKIANNSVKAFKPEIPLWITYPRETLGYLYLETHPNYGIVHNSKNETA